MTTNSQKITVKKVSPLDAQVQKLIDKLNTYQISLYGQPACTLESAEELIQNKAYMVGAFINDRLVGIGAIKPMQTYVEVKRMWVEEAGRGRGVAKGMLEHLEQEAKSRQINQVYLETGNLHHAALKLYERQGYTICDRFGDYQPNEISVYFEKKLV